MSLSHLTDFSDRLSPMLVKELRQGMRARGFTMLFLGFQCLLAFILLTAGASFESDGAGSFASGIIFTLFSIAVLVIQPMRGVAALSSEITGNTIEMMVLTRLSAWRIVFGKWIAIVSQSALILTTIIPYLILRYFFGGMILLGEMVFLTLIFLTSMALTAVMVGFSSTTAKVARLLPIFAIVFMANAIPTYLFRGSFGSGMGFFTLSDMESVISIGCYVAFIGYYGWCALSYGTSSIAPVAENHSTIRRLVALVLTCLAVGVGLATKTYPEVIATTCAIILAPALLISLTEPAIVLPPVCKPFLKRGFIGRIAAVFLLPGWPTGVFYALLLALISAVGIFGDQARPLSPAFEPGLAIVCLSVLGSVLLPALLSAKFSKQENKRFTNFMIFLLLSIILTVGAMMISAMDNNEQLLWSFIWNPPVFLFMLGTGEFDKENLLMAVALVDSAIILTLLFFAMKGYRDYGRVFAETEESLARDAASAEPARTAP